MLLSIIVNKGRSQLELYVSYLFLSFELTLPQSHRETQNVTYLKEIFLSKPILQFPDPNKDYVLYTDTSNNAYSGVLCQPQDNDNDIGPVAYFSGTFTAQNKSWCANEKEAYAVLKSIQRFDYYLRGAKCTLRCDHKHLEPFLPRGMKMVKLDRWAMLLQEYGITFLHIKGKDNILADAISKLCTINIYEDPAEDRLQCSPIKQNTAKPSKVTDSMQLLDSRTAQQLLNVTTKVLQNLQKEDRFCKSEKSVRYKQVCKINFILIMKIFKKKNNCK